MNVQKTIDTLKLQWKNWLPDPIEWVDGSGVSRYNMVTPRTLIAVLKNIHREIGLESIKEYFPKSGRSGTLKNYEIRNVYAKTGSLRHNHNLSGYWISDRGKVYVFSIMANHFTTPTDDIRQGISALLSFAPITSYCFVWSDQDPKKVEIYFHFKLFYPPNVEFEGFPPKFTSTKFSLKHGQLPDKFLAIDT